jgi:hypothetical protein
MRIAATMGILYLFTACLALDPGSMVEKLGLSDCVHECNNRTLVCMAGAEECVHECNLDYEGNAEDRCARECMFDGQGCLEQALRCAEECLRRAEDALN